MDLPIERYVAQVARLRASPDAPIAASNKDTLFAYHVLDSRTVESDGASGALVAALGGDGTTTWLRTSFLWTMHHAQWGSRPGLDAVLLVRIPKAHAQHLLGSAYRTSLDPEDRLFPNQWRGSVQTNDVLIQADPDRDAEGERTTRQTWQIGVRRRAANEFADVCGDAVVDVTRWVREQGVVIAQGRVEDLLVPRQDDLWSGGW